MTVYVASLRRLCPVDQSPNITPADCCVLRQSVRVCQPHAIPSVGWSEGAPGRHSVSWRGRESLPRRARDGVSAGSDDASTARIGWPNSVDARVPVGGAAVGGRGRTTWRCANALRLLQPNRACCRSAVRDAMKLPERVARAEASARFIAVRGGKRDAMVVHRFARCNRREGTLSVQERNSHKRRRRRGLSLRYFTQRDPCMQAGPRAAEGRFRDFSSKL